MPVPTYPWAKQAWVECSTCGFAYPKSDTVRHYKSRKLVCVSCDDAPTHSDYQEFFDRPVEDGDRVSPQKVQS